MVSRLSLLPDMHHLAFIQIENFRSCKFVSLPLDFFTPLVGQNNTGKSTILEAIRWLLKPGALEVENFTDPTKPIVITGHVTGVSKELLDKMPDQKHRAQIEPRCLNGSLWIRASLEGTTARGLKREVWEVSQPAEGAIPENWTKYPTGLPEAITAILPEPLVILAMKDVHKDFTSVSAGTSIKKLIEEIATPVTAKHREQIDKSLAEINSLLTSDSDKRSEALVEFDTKASEAVSEFFPGIDLHLDLPETKLKEFFKSGSLRIKEKGRDVWVDFGQLGSGAQRSIEMGLIRYLAESSEQGEDPVCKLLLIDEPELYLHPQGVRRLKRALGKLSKKGFQVIFSTHNPCMLDRENCEKTITVKKTPEDGTKTRRPLKDVIRQALEAGEHQSRTLFQLGNVAEIYFAEKVILCEGKTDNRWFEAAYERYYGHPPDNDHIVFVPIGSCSDIPKAIDVLRAMEIVCCSVADLDFAFTQAHNLSGYGLIRDDELTVAKGLLKNLQGANGYDLEAGGMPMKGKGWKAAETTVLKEKAKSSHRNA